MREPKNHPAFPVEPYQGDNFNPPVRSNSGMSIRDFFAGLALIGLAKSGLEADVVAEKAFAFSDSMLEERAYTTRK
jgi:hypothetical protein